MKRETIGLGIIFLFCILFLFVHLYIFIFFENSSYTLIEPVVENFELYKICSIIKKVKKLKIYVYDSYTIKSKEGLLISEKIDVVLNKLSVIQQNNCGKHICIDNISPENKKAECSAISNNDIVEINRKLTAIKDDIIKLNVTDQKTYTEKIDKIIKLLTKIEKANLNDLEECKKIQRKVDEYEERNKKGEIDNNNVEEMNKIRQTLEDSYECKLIHKPL